MLITSWLWWVHQEPWECLALVLKAKKLSSVFSSVQIIIDLLFELVKKKLWKSFSHLSQQSLPSSWGLRTKATRVHCIIRSHQCCERLPASDGSGTHLSIFAWHFIIETFCMREQPIPFDIGSSGPRCSTVRCILGYNQVLEMHCNIFPIPMTSG